MELNATNFFSFFIVHPFSNSLCDRKEKTKAFLASLAIFILTFGTLHTSIALLNRYAFSKYPPPREKRVDLVANEILKAASPEEIKKLVESLVCLSKREAQQQLSKSYQNILSGLPTNRIKGIVNSIHRLLPSRLPNNLQECIDIAQVLREVPVEDLEHLTDLIGKLGTDFFSMAYVLKQLNAIPSRNERWDITNLLTFGFYKTLIPRDHHAPILRALAELKIGIDKVQVLSAAISSDKVLRKEHYKTASEAVSLIQAIGNSDPDIFEKYKFHLSQTTNIHCKALALEIAKDFPGVLPSDLVLILDKACETIHFNENGYLPDLAKIRKQIEPHLNVLQFMQQVPDKQSKVMKWVYNFPGAHKVPLLNVEKWGNWLETIEFLSDPSHLDSILESFKTIPADEWSAIIQTLRGLSEDAKKNARVFSHKYCSFVFLAVAAQPKETRLEIFKKAISLLSDAPPGEVSSLHIRRLILAIGQLPPDADILNPQNEEILLKIPYYRRAFFLETIKMVPEIHLPNLLNVFELPKNSIEIHPNITQQDYLEAAILVCDPSFPQNHPIFSKIDKETKITLISFIAKFKGKDEALQIASSVPPDCLNDTLIFANRYLNSAQLQMLLRPENKDEFIKIVPGLKNSSNNIFLKELFSVPNEKILEFLQIAVSLYNLAKKVLLSDSVVNEFFIPIYDNLKESFFPGGNWKELLNNLEKEIRDIGCFSSYPILDKEIKEKNKILLKQLFLHLKEVHSILPLIVGIVDSLDWYGITDERFQSLIEVLFQNKALQDNGIAKSLCEFLEKRGFVSRQINHSELLDIMFLLEIFGRTTQEAEKILAGYPNVPIETKNALILLGTQNSKFSLKDLECFLDLLAKYPNNQLSQFISAAKQLINAAKQLRIERMSSEQKRILIQSLSKLPLEKIPLLYPLCVRYASLNLPHNLEGCVDRLFENIGKMDFTEDCIAEFSELETDESFWNLLLVISNCQIPDRITLQIFNALRDLHKKLENGYYLVCCHLILPERLVEALLEIVPLLPDQIKPEYLREMLRPINYFPKGTYKDFLMQRGKELLLAEAIALEQFCGPALNFLPHLLKNRPEIQRAIVDDLFGRLKLPDQNLAYNLGRVILRDIHFSPELTELAQNVNSVASQDVNNPQNPYILHKKLEEARKIEIDLVMKSLEIDGIHFCFNPSFPKPVKTTQIRFGDLPGFDQTALITYFEEFEKRISALSPPEQDKMYLYIQNLCFNAPIQNKSPKEHFLWLKANFTHPEWDIEIPKLLRKEYIPEDIVPRSLALLCALIQHLSTISNTLETIQILDENDKPVSLQISPLEQALLMASGSIQGCRAGQGEGLAIYYASLPPQDKTARLEIIQVPAEDETARLKIILYQKVQIKLESIFTSLNMFQELTGINREALSKQLSHQSLFLKNLIGHRVGLDHEFEFDVYGGHVLPVLQNLIRTDSSEVLFRNVIQALHIFYRYFPVEFLINSLQEYFNLLQSNANQPHLSKEQQENRREEVAKFMAQLRKYADETDFIEDETFNYKLTDLGAAKVWEGIGYLVRL